MKDQHRPAGFHNVHVRPTVDHIDQENRSRNNCLNVYFYYRRDVMFSAKMSEKKCAFGQN